MMKIIFLIFGVCISGVWAQMHDDLSKQAIVKVYTVAKRLNYQEPWASSMAQSTGSGAIIEGNMILTNAHVVANRTFLEVQRFGERKRYLAKVHAVSHQADLALLKVEDETFFKGVAPLKLGQLPQIEQEISVYGYPMGGSTLSATLGVVSRIEHARYTHSGEAYLAIQVDAAVNPGNSGGPAISEGKIVGVVMQLMSNSQNIGYLVPVNMVRHFLDDLKDGHYDGFPELGISTQSMENPTIKAYYGLDDNTTGKLVVDMSYNAPAKGIIEIDDIIVSIDGHKIEDDGTVAFRENEYTDFAYYVDMHQIGESVTLELIRKGKKMKVNVKLDKVPNDVLLVKTTEYDTMPRYFIEGGYVFSPLSTNLLISTNLNRLKLSYFASQWPSKKQKEIVVLLKVLASDISRGNNEFMMWPIKKVNGETFDSFKTFYEKMRDCKQRYIVLEDSDGLKLVIDKQEAQKAQKEILQRYNIEFDRSADLRD